MEPPVARFRALSYLPWYIRLPLTLPVLGVMIWANYTAFSNKRAFDTFRAEERAGHHVRAHPAPAQPTHHTPPKPHHDPNAYYPSEHVEASASQDGLWTALAVGGAGLSVLMGGFALFSLFGPSSEPDTLPEDPSA